VKQDTERIDLRPKSKSWRKSTGEDDRCRSQRVFAIIEFERIAKVAKAAGAIFFVDMAHIAGLVAAAYTQALCPMRYRLHHHA